MLTNPITVTRLKSRAKVISLIRQYLESNGFIEVETPILGPNAGGAIARPFITRPSLRDHLNKKKRYRDLRLRIAPELYLKVLIHLLKMSFIFI